MRRITHPAANITAETCHNRRQNSSRISDGSMVFNFFQKLVRLKWGTLTLPKMFLATYLAMPNMVLVTYLAKYGWDIVKVGVKRTSLHVCIFREHERVVKGMVSVGNTVAHHTTGCMSIHCQFSSINEILVLSKI